MKERTTEREAPSKKDWRLSPQNSAEIVVALGGTAEVSRLCGIAPSSVSDWKREGMPRPWVLFLRERFRTLPIMATKEIIAF